MNDATTISSHSIHSMPLIHLEPDPQNVRGKMSGIDELADSIRAHGIIQPLVVAAIGAGRYRIIVSFRQTCVV